MKERRRIKDQMGSFFLFKNKVKQVGSWKLIKIFWLTFIITWNLSKKTCSLKSVKV